MMNMALVGGNVKSLWSYQIQTMHIFVIINITLINKQAPTLDFQFQQMDNHTTIMKFRYLYM
jgi:hypothetical protein